MNQFDEWWGKGKGSEQWARTIEKDILGAIKVAFNAGVSSEKKRLAELREAVQPFVNLVKTTSGRIPTEKLSAFDWDRLCKAHELSEKIGQLDLSANNEIEMLRKNDMVFRKVIEKLRADNHGMTPNWLLDFEKL